MVVGANNVRPIPNSAWSRAAGDDNNNKDNNNVPDNDNNYAGLKLGNTLYYKYQKNGIHFGALPGTLRSEPIYSLPKLVPSGFEPETFASSAHSANCWTTDVINYDGDDKVPQKF